MNSLDSAVSDNEKGDKNLKLYFDISVIFKMLTGRVKSVSTIYLEKLVRILLKTKQYTGTYLIKMYLCRRSLLAILCSRFSNKAHAMDRFKDLLPTTVISLFIIISWTWKQFKNKGQIGIKAEEPRICLANSLMEVLIANI